MDDVIAVLALLQPSGYVEDADSIVPEGWPRMRLLEALQQGHERGFIHVEKPLRGDDRLLSARQIRLTPAGYEALKAEVAKGGM